MFSFFSPFLVKSDKLQEVKKPQTTAIETTENPDDTFYQFSAMTWSFIPS